MARQKSNQHHQAERCFALRANPPIVNEPDRHGLNRVKEMTHWTDYADLLKIFITRWTACGELAGPGGAPGEPGLRGLSGTGSTPSLAGISRA